MIPRAVYYFSGISLIEAVAHISVDMYKNNYKYCDRKAGWQQIRTIFFCPIQFNRIKLRVIILPLPTIYSNKLCCTPTCNLILEFLINNY